MSKTWLTATTYLTVAICNLPCIWPVSLANPPSQPSAQTLCLSTMFNAGNAFESGRHWPVIEAFRCCCMLSTALRNYLHRMFVRKVGFDENLLHSGIAACNIPAACAQTIALHLVLSYHCFSHLDAKHAVSCWSYDVAGSAWQQ